MPASTRAELDDPSQVMPRDGVYVGRWGGYIAEMITRGTCYTFKTAIGIRTLGVECRVTIKDGQASVTVE